MSDAALPSCGFLDGRDHVLPVRIYYEDTDFTGVVYHGNYVRLFERGRSEYLRLLGVAHADLAAEGSAFTVVRLEIDYKKPARIDDALQVRTTWREIRGPRMFIDQRITRGADLMAQACVQVACIDLSGRARKPPPALVAAVRPLTFSGDTP